MCRYKFAEPLRARFWECLAERGPTNSGGMHSETHFLVLFNTRKRTRKEVIRGVYPASNISVIPKQQKF